MRLHEFRLVLARQLVRSPLVHGYGHALHDNRTILGRDVVAQVRDVFGEKVFQTIISKSVRLEESPAYKESIFTHAPRSSGAKQYAELGDEVIERA